MTPTSHIKNILSFVAVIGLVLGGAFFYSTSIKKDAPTNREITKASVQQTKKSTVPTNVVAQADNTFSFSVGPTDAKVVVVEFIDFQCPFCREAHTTLKQLMQQYQGASVRFVIRHFPIIPIHPYALASANASLCARDQGKFLTLHDLFYERQEYINEAAIYSFATDAQLDLSQFNACLAKKKYQSMIVKDISDAESLGVQGTPTWFVNGEKFEGAIPFEMFAQIIDSKLQ
ncbi:MAG: DsbA family protein [bacterium]|nr:DsbA family protein [bacterium]